MIIEMLKAKIHRATVTQCDLHYEGSITIDRDLLDKAGILINEKVDVLNINNGNRFTTYAIEGKRGSGIIGINGAAAHLVEPNDLVIICAYCALDTEEAKTHEPTVILLGDNNQIKN